MTFQPANVILFLFWFLYFLIYQWPFFRGISNVTVNLKTTVADFSLLLTKLWFLLRICASILWIFKCTTAPVILLLCDSYKIAGLDCGKGLNCKTCSTLKWSYCHCGEVKIPLTLPLDSWTLYCYIDQVITARRQRTVNSNNFQGNSVVTIVNWLEWLRPTTNYRQLSLTINLANWLAHFCSPGTTPWHSLALALKLTVKGLPLPSFNHKRWSLL